MMDIKTEVRRRITDLTRFAYERGYQEGAQAALAEIETIAAEDVTQQLEGVPAPLEAIAETKRVDVNRPKPAAKPKAAKKPAMKAKTVKSAPKSKAAKKPVAKLKTAKTKATDAKPKSIVVQEAMRTLLADKGEAGRDEVLKAAQAENPAITKFDLSNGIRTLVKRGDIKVASDDPGRFLPSLNNAAPQTTTDQPSI
jgi:hypothetical protein